MILKPAASAWAPNTSMLYTLDAARKDLGLFSDTNYDVQVTAIIQTAQDHVSSILGGPIQSTTRTDFFRFVPTSMAFSWRADPTASVTLKWMAESGEVSFAMLTTPSTVQADMFVDYSAGRAGVLTLTADGEERARALLESDGLDARRTNAVELVYSSGAVTQGRGTAAPKEAVRNLVQDLFSQGDNEIGQASNARAMELLGPYVSQEALFV